MEINIAKVLKIYKISGIGWYIDCIKIQNKERSNAEFLKNWKRYILFIIQVWSNVLVTSKVINNLILSIKYSFMGTIDGIFFRFFQAIFGNCSVIFRHRDGFKIDSWYLYISRSEWKYIPKYQIHFLDFNRQFLKFNRFYFCLREGFVRFIMYRELNSWYGTLMFLKFDKIIKFHR